MFEKVRRKVDIVPMLQEPDVPVQRHGVRKGMVSRLGSGVKSLFTTSNRQDTLYRTAPDTNPAWAQRHQQNLKNCLFYQIPPGMLHHIIEYTDGATRQIMRRTCRIFLIFIADIDIRKFESQQRIGEGQASWFDRIEVQNWLIWRRLVWPTHGSLNDRPTVVKERVRALLAQDTSNQCRSCRTLQQNGIVQTTLSHFKQSAWCSGCGKNHPLLLFSATQRNLPPSQRICIGREGTLRLCSHEAITWNEINQKAVALANENAEEGYGTLRSCTHKSHHSPEAAPWGNLILPQVHLSTSRYGTHVHVNWTSPIFDLDPKVPVRKDHLRDHLASRKHIFHHTPCPHLTLDDGQLLIPFEPNQCVCFEDQQATNHPPYLPQCHDCGHPTKCCRCLAATEEPDRRGHFMLTQYEEWRMRVKRGKKHTLDQHIPACHRYKCAECTAEYSWVRDRNCRVFLRFEKVFKLATSPTSMEWLRVLDPESWGISGDDQLRHVVWCPERECATGSRWRRLLEALRAHADEDFP